jgi:hypothetical protein
MLDANVTCDSGDLTRLMGVRGTCGGGFGRALNVGGREGGRGIALSLVDATERRRCQLSRFFLAFNASSLAKSWGSMPVSFRTSS